jgi:hypothetical protein
MTDIVGMSLENMRITHIRKPDMKYTGGRPTGRFVPCYQQSNRFDVVQGNLWKTKHHRSDS